MAFRRISDTDRRIQLVSLIDLIFIMLIFFIITSMLIKLTKGESQLYVPVPRNEPGEAQILVQILDQNSFLWLDHTAIDTLNIYRHLIKGSADPADKINLLLDKMTVDSKGLQKQILQLRTDAIERPNKDYFVVIRCPEEYPYYYATDIIEKLVGTPNFEYGCVAGSIDEMRNSSSFTVKGNVMQIDF